jgi:type II secretory pathway component PulF
VTSSGTAFHYRAIDRAGHRVKGREAAASPAALAQTLESRGLLVLDLTPATEPEGAVARIGFRRRHEVLEVTRAMSALLPAGLPLTRALAASSALATGDVAGVLAEVRTQVERGEPLAAALAQHPHLFSPLYTGMVRAGERSGNLSGAFTRLAAQLEREDELRSKILSASIYPLLLAVAGGAAVVVLLVFVMPRFVELLQGTGAALPRSTAMMLALSAMMRRFWPFVLALATTPALVAAWMRVTPNGRRASANLFLSVPGIGAFRRHALAARFARLMAVLLSGGAPLLAALDDTLECLSDPVAKDEVTRIQIRVREGVSLQAAISEGALFPPLLGQLVAVGEESARLQDFLLKAAEILEERTHRSLERMVALAEPAMIVCFGGMVGFVALSLLQAIYSVNAGSFR